MFLLYFSSIASACQTNQLYLILRLTFVSEVVLETYLLLLKVGKMFALHMPRLAKTIPTTPQQFA